MQVCLFFMGSSPTKAYAVSFLRFLDHTQTHPVELLQTSDQLVAEAASYTNYNAADENLYPLRDWNPRFQQSGGFRPTPQTVRSLGSAGCVLRGLVIQTSVD